MNLEAYKRIMGYRGTTLGEVKKNQSDMIYSQRPVTSMIIIMTTSQTKTTNCLRRKAAQKQRFQRNI